MRRGTRLPKPPQYQTLDTFAAEFLPHQEKRWATEGWPFIRVGEIAVVGRLHRNSGDYRKLVGWSYSDISLGVELLTQLRHAQRQDIAVLRHSITSHPTMIHDAGFFIAQPANDADSTNIYQRYYGAHTDVVLSTGFASIYFSRAEQTARLMTADVFRRVLGASFNVTIGGLPQDE